MNQYRESPVEGLTNSKIKQLSNVYAAIIDLQVQVKMFLQHYPADKPFDTSTRDRIIKYTNEDFEKIQRLIAEIIDYEMAEHQKNKRAEL